MAWSASRIGTALSASWQGQIRPTTERRRLGCRQSVGCFAQAPFFNQSSSFDLTRGSVDLDSYDVWPLVIGETKTSPRQELPVNANTLISGRFKLLTGSVSPAGWTGPAYPNASSGHGDAGAVLLNCTTPGKLACLFDVVQDPEERHDIALEQPELVQTLIKRLAQLSKSFWANRERGVDACPPGTPPPCACWMAKHKYGGFLGPYQEVPA